MVPRFGRLANGDEWRFTSYQKPAQIGAHEIGWFGAHNDTPCIPDETSPLIEHHATCVIPVSLIAASNILIVGTVVIMS